MPRRHRPKACLRTPERAKQDDDFEFTHVPLL